MVKLTQLILHFGDKMNVEQKRYGYGPSKYCGENNVSEFDIYELKIKLVNLL